MEGKRVINKDKLKVFFITPVPVEGAGCRFRLEQYRAYLKSHGIESVLSPFYSTGFYRIVYQKRRQLLKIYYFTVSIIRRIIDLFRASRYDIIYIYRESLPICGPLFENAVKKMKKRIIYDFDDAVFLPNASSANKFIEKLREPGNAAHIIKISDLVIAGNDYLRDYALKFADRRNVNVIPTAIDTDIYTPKETKKDKDVVIGWIGTQTTIPYLSDIIPVYKEIINKYDNVYFHFVGHWSEKEEHPRFIYKEWSLENELNLLKEFDIGVMPMPDDLWTRGKCGFKAILYMSMGIPPVASPVGVNKEIIDDGYNGFLAGNSREWLEKLSVLIEDESKRLAMGKNAREKAINYYSFRVNAPKMLNSILRVKGEGTI